ncbi:hypothetical protein ACRE_010200 [Hapsidospora chrysogenum ATCC 11550]|uniref:Uncharacterized protein n=1 Tax=Hapsidospora chrysogenum (strain ATCC 11550 / CBS 779.69 / DSM 880 / IAM 14645 / JCM 23072 / IMI 49137) TaxID=857340 RepID=A0A086TFH3_HAPC1|nr:hypothetical protein ACRE_010200 [Hapsidospora chrysogenum ATCC 11550]
MPAANKPKLGKLATPISATFPSEITSATTAATATPLSAVAFPIKPDPDFIKTPISPPSAYTDFLSKAMSLNSPLPPSGQTTPESTSAPNTASTERSDCSSKAEQSSPATSENEDKFPPATAPIAPPTPFASSAAPMSAPPTGPATFPSLKVPPSPSIANLDSPARSPFSARSVHSVFDWEAALKARTQSLKKKPSRTSVRHIREVVTRTVTYTPRMEPAPKGKRRKVE